MNLDLLAKIIGYAFMAVSVGLGVVCALMFILDVIWRRVIQFKDGSVLVREFLIWKRNAPHEPPPTGDSREPKTL